MSFRITGLDPAPFRHLYHLPQAELAAHGARRHHVTTEFTTPDRIELRDLTPGETALLLNFTHQPAGTPFRASHAIYIREGAETPFDATNTIPAPILRRIISLRAFSDSGNLLAADLAPGTNLAPLIETFFANPEVACIHAHYAKPGCFAARITRA